MRLTVTDLRRYPVKSFGGESLRSAAVERWGLRGDRRWVIVDGAGELITARALHTTLLLHARATDASDACETGIVLSAPGRPDLEVTVPAHGEAMTVGIGRGSITVLAAGPGPDAWLSDALGQSVRLGYLADPTQRPTNPAFTKPTDRVSAADAYPLLLTTEDSLAALNDLIAEGSAGVHDPLTMRRFRPNVVVRGAPAWAEDDWRRIVIGPVEFRVVKGCDRCVVTTLDPDTAQGGREPIATLARHRRFDGAVWFGMQLVPDLVDQTAGEQPVAISVGDPVEILESVTPGGGPPR